MVVFKRSSSIWGLWFLSFCWMIELCYAVNGKTKTDFIDCSNPCNGGDVSYHLITSTRTMKLLNYTYRGRTYSQEGSETFMGPTMRVKPGQSLWIKVENQFQPNEPGAVQPPTAVDYWNMLQNPGEKIKYTFYKPGVSDPSLLKVDHANMPHDFDVTNLHLHGLDIAVHMFDPVGTTQKYAPHIAIRPGQCYCYQFDIPDHHPDGMYWYHPHLHGSSAIQIWSGMLGLLYVEGSLMEELKAYNVKNTQEFVIWDPAFQTVSGNPEYNLQVDEFLLGQTTLSKIHPFLVNGQMNPTFTVKVNEVLHLRTLCATIENENTFIIYPEGRENEPWEEDIVLPFYVIAADGVTFGNTERKTILVMSGGQRFEILIQIDTPGRYVISQQGIQGMQFFDMYGHPHDQILATIEVVPEEGELPVVPLDTMTLTPGYQPEESIRSTDIVASETIVFSMGANRDQVPFPQYYVNGKPFDPNRLDFHAHPGEAREYLLVNGDHNVHPFHIHVNRFQVKEMGSELDIHKYPALKAVLDFNPNHAWRDTVIVPPNGRARIWVQYKNFTGKTVFHCHFLAHEDTGMMSTLFIGPVDWVFEWEQHGPLVIGLVLGMTLMAVLATLYYRNRPPQYTALEMNQVKSKTRD